MKLTPILACFSAVAMCGCGSVARPTHSADGGVDAAAMRDASADAGADAQAAHDAGGNDASMLDGSRPADSGARDAGIDASRADAGRDAGQDAGRDAGQDAGRDAGASSPSDAGTSDAGGPQDAGGGGDAGPSADDCVTALDLDMGGTYHGTTCGANDTATASCNPAATPDRVFFVHGVARLAAYNFIASSGFVFFFVSPGACSYSGGGCLSSSSVGASSPAYVAVEKSGGGCGTFDFTVVPPP